MMDHWLVILARKGPGILWSGWKKSLYTACPGAISKVVRVLSGTTDLDNGSRSEERDDEVNHDIPPSHP